MKKKLMVSVVSALVLISALVAITMAKPKANHMVFEVEVSDYKVRKGVDEMYDMWFYVTNPSRDMETAPTVQRLPVHVVTVQLLTMRVENPDGTIDEIDLDPSVHFAYRWNLVVYPGERSLVFFIGTAVASLDTGTYQYTYTLNVEFEGTSYDLEQSFKIQVLPEED